MNRASSFNNRLHNSRKNVKIWIFSNVKRFVFMAAIIIMILNLGFISPKAVSAAPSLTITPITWNVIGLDSNNVKVGPDTFPVGARVCNTGDAVVGDLVATFNWDSVNTYINLRTESLPEITISGLAAGTPANPSCYDFYFEVTVTRNSAAYATKRQFHIEVSSGAAISEFSTLNTPTPRELYVERLISQNRNSTDGVSYAPLTTPETPLVSVPPGGTLSFMVGNTYTIKLDASTATQGYNQLEAFINFPNTIFQILSVDSTYTADTSGYVANTSDKLYADACLWDMDPTSPTYHSCIGSDGKVGGKISTTYVVKIISVGNASYETLNTMIYDFSGSSFHYNSDFSSSSRVFSISSSLSMTKTFSPVAINAGSTSRLSISITNNSGSDVTGVSLTDPFPDGLVVAGTPDATAPGPNCLTPSFSPSAADMSITYSGGVAANSTCVISVNVTAAINGTYVNTTDSLFINSTDSTIIASANLQVEDIPTSETCAIPVTVAQWKIPDSTLPPTVTVNNTGGTALAYTNSAANNITSGNWRITDASVGGSASTISITGDRYYRFQLDTSDFTGIKMSFDYLKGASGATHLDVYYGNSALISPPSNPILLSGAQFVPTTSLQSSGSLDFTEKTNPVGDTYFFLYVYGADNSGGNAWLGVDEITFVGCPKTTQEINKAFSPNPISAGTVSTLTFTLKNYAVTDVSNVAFTDTFPAGMIVDSSAVVSQCGGTVTAVKDSSVISLSGGTIPGKGTDEFGYCTVEVQVATSVAGTYPNTSGYLSINGTAFNSHAMDTLIVLDPPLISKAFSPNPIYTGDPSTLTFTITNPNSDSAINGVAFTDVFPPNLSIFTSPESLQCGGTITSDSASISLAGGSIEAGGTCTVNVVVTASLVGDYENTTENVTSINAGTGNTATDTLIVQTTHPGIAVKKEVSTSPTGPWAAYVNGGPTDSVYYRVIIENIGDVPLTALYVTDETSPDNSSIETAINDCVWPDILPVASATVNPTATCIKGPFTGLPDTIDNTVTAHGTYNSETIQSEPSKATYLVSDLVLVKSASPSTFTIAGDLITYSYTVTNTGDLLQGPISVSMFDTNLSVPCIVDLGFIGNADSNFDNGESFTCSAAYTVTAFDASVGSVTNTAFATVTPSIGVPVRTNMDRETVFSNNPDLIVSKTNNADGYAEEGTPFTWTLTVINQGPVPADFGIGAEILRDQLPSGPDYVLVTHSPAEISEIDCLINATDLLICSTTGPVSIPASGGFFTVNVEVTPSSTAGLINVAQVDPDNVIIEGDEGNNYGSDELNVIPDSTIFADLQVTKTDGITEINASNSAETTYTIRVTNAGPSAVTGAILKDTLDSGLTATAVACSTSLLDQCVSAPNLSDLTGAAGISLPALAEGEFYEITLTVDVTATSGSVTNTVTVAPPAGTTDPDNMNNTASDENVVNEVADLSISKTDYVNTVLANGTTTYTIRVTNSGPSVVTGALLDENLPVGLTATALTCSDASGNQCSGPIILSDLLESGLLLPELGVGEFYEIELSATIVAASGIIANQVSVTVPEGVIEPNLGNNTVVDSNTVVPEESPTADLTITKDNGTTTVDEDGSTTYTITVINNGADTVTGALLEDTLPAGLSASGLVCSDLTENKCVSNPDLTDFLVSGIALPQLANGDFYQIELTAIVTASSGSITNNASVTLPVGTIDPNPLNNTDSDQDTINPAQLSADLEVIKENISGSVTLNENTVYTIRVTNNGPDAVTGAILRDSLPTGLNATTVVCASVSGNKCVTNPVLANLITSGISLPLIADGEFYEVELTAIVIASSGSITNTAIITMPPGVIDPESNNNSSETEISVISEYKVYLPIIIRSELQVPVIETWNIAIGMEDNRLLAGNDYDYNDWLVDMDTTFTYSSATRDHLNSLEFSIIPKARGAAYEHRYLLNFPANTFTANGTVITRVFDKDHQLIQTTVSPFESSIANTYVIFEKTSAALPGMANVSEGEPMVNPQRYADFTLTFNSPTLFEFDSDASFDPHGSGLFFVPTLHVLNTGEMIRMGDMRALMVPVDNWAWPEERIRIDLAYTRVTFVPGDNQAFIFPDQWWLDPNQCVLDGLMCVNAPTDLVFIK